ncbi:hypothetical protein Tco_0685378 [Tanacetum coccineum]
MMKHLIFPTTFTTSQTLVRPIHCFGVESIRRWLYVCHRVLASGCGYGIKKELLGFALQEMKIHPLMLLIQTLSTISQTFSPTLHNPSTNHTHASYVGTILTTVMIVHLGSRFVKDLVPIPSESKDTSESDSDCDLPSCDDFSPINIPEGNSMTFSNPLFYSNGDFTFSDNESLSDEDVLEDNVKIYLNPFFKFDDEHIFSDINPLFDEVLENIESKDSYVFRPQEAILIIIDAFLDVDISMDIENDYHNSEGDIIYLESLLIDDTIPNLPPKVFLDHDSKNLKDKPDNKDLKSMVKVFDLGIWEKIFSPTYVRLPFEDCHYLSLTYVI